EEGEDPAGAAARELAEETGLVVVGHCRQVFEGEHGVAVESTRGSRVSVFCVRFYSGEPRESEAGCPVTWWTREEFLKWSPFAPFYERAFAQIYADKAYRKSVRVDRETRGQHESAGGVAAPGWVRYCRFCDKIDPGNHLCDVSVNGLHSVRMRQLRTDNNNKEGPMGDGDTEKLLDFGEAIKALKDGKRVRRAGWPDGEWLDLVKIGDEVHIYIRAPEGNQAPWPI